MTARPFLVLALVAVAAAGCEPTPTGPATPLDPQFAGTGSPRFTEAAASGPGTAGQLFVSFKMAGVGAKAPNVITGSATGAALWACRREGLEFDGWPAPEIVNELVSGTFPITGTGQVSGAGTVSPPPNELDCAVGFHAPVLVSVEYSDVQVAHPDAGSFAIPGTFARAFHTFPDHDLPVITDVTAAQTTLTLDGGTLQTSVSITNPGFLLEGIIVQAWITQGDAWRAAGGASVSCGAELGELPTGTCTVQQGVGVSELADGYGTLEPGPARLEIHLRGSPSVRVLSGWRMDITLQ